MTHGNRLSIFLSVLIFYKNLLPYSSTDFPLYSQQQKRDLKHYSMKWRFSPSFPYISGAAPVTQPGISKIYNRGQTYRTFSCIVYFNSFADTRLHIEMLRYCMLYTNNRTWQITCKYNYIKICYKNDKLAFEGNRTKEVRETVLS